MLLFESAILGWTMECFMGWGKFLRLSLSGMVLVAMDWWVYEVGIFLSGFKPTIVAEFILVTPACTLFSYFAVPNNNKHIHHIFHRNFGRNGAWCSISTATTWHGLVSGKKRFFLDTLSVYHRLRHSYVALDPRWHPSRNNDSCGTQSWVWQRRSGKNICNNCNYCCQ